MDVLWEIFVSPEESLATLINLYSVYVSEIFATLRDFQ